MKRGPSTKRAPCSECGETKLLRARWLCPHCYNIPAIKRKYAKSHYAPGREPTASELDALIRKRMRNLPKWWSKYKEMR